MIFMQKIEVTIYFSIELCHYIYYVIILIQPLSKLYSRSYNLENQLIFFISSQKFMILPSKVKL